MTTKTKFYTIVYTAIFAVFAMVVLTAPYSIVPTGNTKVVQESVCAHYYIAGAGGTARRVCDRYQAVNVTAVESTYRNLLGYEWVDYNR